MTLFRPVGRRCPSTWAQKLSFASAPGAKKSRPPAEALFARKAMGRGVAALRTSGYGRYGMMEFAPSTITDWPE